MAAAVSMCKMMFNNSINELAYTEKGKKGSKESTGGGKSGKKGKAGGSSEKDKKKSVK